LDRALNGDNHCESAGALAFNAAKVLFVV